jgi:subtilisin family serine protease
LTPIRIFARPGRVLAASLAALLTLGACASADIQTVRVAEFTGPSASGRALRDRAPRVRRIPRPTSDELARSWGVQAVGADSAYRLGATGKGVTIALIDTGVPAGATDVTLSKASIDLIKDRPAPSPAFNRAHAQSVAGPLVSILNGKGTLGVAYDATLLSIRADMEGACESQCAFRTADVARGIDYALAHRARVIVLALVSPTPGRPLSPVFERALQRAADAGAIVVIAAGNTADANPAWPARYAADPKFRGQVIAVGATERAGDLAPWSVRAGAARDAFLAAPGAEIITDCGPKYCYLVSGTSFSAPYVAGAAALLMDAYPTLSGQEVADLLLRHARDLGEPGSDPVYGRGVLDVAAAFRAAGRLAAGTQAAG